jgi:hypothetical protein
MREQDADTVRQVDDPAGAQETRERIGGLRVTPPGEVFDERRDLEIGGKEHARFRQPHHARIGRVAAERYHAANTRFMYEQLSV